jgi:hypothetical protein
LRVTKHNIAPRGNHVFALCILYYISHGDTQGGFLSP